MTQHSECYSPIHNSIAPIKLLLDNDVNVALGIDNIEDIFMQFCDGDLTFELRLLAESTRIYYPHILRKNATNNIGFGNTNHNYPKTEELQQKELYKIYNAYYLNKNHI